MFNIIRVLVVILGPIVGYFFVDKTYTGILVGLGFGAVIIALELMIDLIRLDVVVFGLIGAVGGFVVSKGLDWYVLRLENPVYYQALTRFSVLINLFLVILGCMIAIRKKGELDLLEKDIIVKGKKNTDIKVVDTSVLIDGRIADVIETGFLSGKFIVPRFVLHGVWIFSNGFRIFTASISKSTIGIILTSKKWIPRCWSWPRNWAARWPRLIST